MTVVSRLTGVGTFFSYNFDENVVTKFRVGGGGTTFSNEFDENTATTLSGTQRMSATSTGGLIVLDSLNEVDPIETTFSTTNLQLHIDPNSGPASETAPVNQIPYTTAGTYTFTVPPTITSISAVCVGGGGGGGGNDGDSDESGGGGGGGALAYQISIAVTPGESLTVVVGAAGAAGGNINNDGIAGGTSSISRGATILVGAGGGGGGIYRAPGVGEVNGAGGTIVSGTGGAGGVGGLGNNRTRDPANGGGGGGAGGYSGAGGNGGSAAANDSGVVGTAGAGGGGGGGGSGLSLTARGGGGVGILGAGANGAAGAINGSGGGGSNGSNGTFAGGNYGGGGAGRSGSSAGSGGTGSVGAVRIIYGTGRSYPSTLVTDQTVVNYAFTLSDLSGNGRTASSVNEAFWFSTIPSTPTGTVSLDGVNKYMTVASYKGVTGTDARTSIIWFKTSAINLSSILFGWGNTTAGQKWNMGIDPTTYKARVEIATGSVVGGSTTPDLADSHWHMITATAPASGTANDIKLYVDGDLLTDVTITSGATTINTASGSDVSFGASLADVDPGYLSGNLSRFLIYNRQLTDFEIKVVYRDILNRFFPS